MSIGYKDMRAHPVIEGCSGYKVEKRIADLCQNHEKMWLESHVDHVWTYYWCHSLIFCNIFFCYSLPVYNQSIERNSVLVMPAC